MHRQVGVIPGNIPMSDIQKLVSKVKNGMAAVEDGILEKNN